MIRVSFFTNAIIPLFCVWYNGVDEKENEEESAHLWFAFMASDRQPIAPAFIFFFVRERLCPLVSDRGDVIGDYNGFRSSTADCIEIHLRARPSRLAGRMRPKAISLPHESPWWHQEIHEAPISPAGCLL